MYNILLVDDERQIRQGLKAKMNWQQHGFDLCGEAADGKEALECIEQLQPHVVITDIRMPIMDGVQLLETCSTLYPNIHFIVLSGYEDFNYVKAALKYGASDYLLKPVIRKELASLLDSIKQRLDASMQERAEEDRLKHRLDQNIQRMREQFWLQAVRSDSDYMEWAEEGRLLGLGAMLDSSAWVCFATVEISDNRHEGEERQPDALLLLAAHFMSLELLDQWKDEAYLFRDSAMPQLLHIVLRTEAYGEEQLKNWLDSEFCIQLASMLKVKLRLGIGEAVQGPSEWKKGYNSSRLRWMQQPIGEAAMEDNKSLELSSVVQKQLSAAIMDANRAESVRLLKTWLDSSLSLTLQDQSVWLLRLLLFLDTIAIKYGLKLEETEYIISGLPESLWKCLTQGKAETLFTSIAEQLIQQIERDQQTGGYEVIKQVEAYLLEHYADENISLTQLANHFHLNTTYLSELFKKTIGKNYSDYLTEIRIQKAKQLMNDHHLRIADVSELVGFSNSNYFSQVFKKIAGCSPVEYRQKQLNNRKK